MPVTKIKIISFSVFDPNLLKNVAVAVGKEFRSEVQIVEGRLDLSEFFDASRSQYDGYELLKTIDNSYAGNSHKTIGLFKVDLFIPILTYIFGQAYLGGRSAIASSHRLSNARYGLKEDPVLFRERITKEVIHELGHTFGLIHCYHPECVMGSSTYVEDIDQKSHNLCSSCREKLHNAT